MRENFTLHIYSLTLTRMSSPTASETKITKEKKLKIDRKTLLKFLRYTAVLNLSHNGEDLDEIRTELEKVVTMETVENRTEDVTSLVDYCGDCLRIPQESLIRSKDMPVAEMLQSDFDKMTAK